MTIIKTENSNFKKPPIQMNTIQQTLNPPPAPVSIAQAFAPSPGQQQSNNISNQNDPQKRRGCRCGNATAAPGKLTCCGQRCPCYVESKACMDCKCKGCRNPHYVDGHKKVNRRQRKLWASNNFGLFFRCVIKFPTQRSNRSSSKTFSPQFSNKQRWSRTSSTKLSSPRLR